jgi:hypothetical protein
MRDGTELKLSHNYREQSPTTTHWRAVKIADGTDNLQQQLAGVL